MLRGLIFGFLQTVIRVVQTMMINTWETQAAMISVLLQVIFAVLVLLWGFFDGRNDANAQPDPDRRADLAMTWLIAGLVAGVLSGALCTLISLFYKDMYVMGLVQELTVFAAYTALLVFLMAMIGVAIGRFLVDRRYNKRGLPVSAPRRPGWRQPGHRRVRGGRWRPVRGDAGGAGSGGAGSRRADARSGLRCRPDGGNPVRRGPHAGSAAP